MVSSEYELLLFLLPNLMVGLVYLVFLKQPMKMRLMAASPSLAFLLIPALGLCLALFEMRYEPMAKVVGALATVAYLLALGLVALVLVRIKTWLHLLQVVNVIAGTMLWYMVSLVLAGDIA